MQTKTIRVFCDGSCSSSDPKKRGGFAAVIDSPFSQENLITTGGMSYTTISQMETLAVIRGVALANEHSILQNQYGNVALEVFSDSKYVVDCASNAKEIIANKTLWRVLREVVSAAKLTFRNLTIHHIPRNSEPEAELADFLAGEARKALVNLPIKIKVSPA